MTLSELKTAVDAAIQRAKEHEESPNHIIVSIQIDDVNDGWSIWADSDLELSYDGNMNVSGCVLLGLAEFSVDTPEGIQ